MPSEVAKEAGTERKGLRLAPTSARPPMMRLLALVGSKETAVSCPAAPST